MTLQIEPRWPVRVGFHPFPHFSWKVVHVGPRSVDLAGFLAAHHDTRVEEQDGAGRDDIVPFDNDGFQALDGHSVTSVLLALELAMLDETSNDSQGLSARVIDGQFFAGHEAGLPMDWNCQRELRLLPLVVEWE